MKKPDMADEKLMEERMMTTNELLQDIAYNLYLIEFRLRMGEESTYKPLIKEEYLKGWRGK